MSLSRFHGQKGPGPSTAARSCRHCCGWGVGSQGVRPARCTSLCRMDAPAPSPLRRHPANQEPPRSKNCCCTNDMYDIYDMLYLTCHTEPIRLTEHLRGTRKSEPKRITTNNRPEVSTAWVRALSGWETTAVRHAEGPLLHPHLAESTCMSLLPLHCRRGPSTGFTSRRQRMIDLKPPIHAPHAPQRAGTLCGTCVCWGRRRMGRHSANDLPPAAL